MEIKTGASILGLKPEILIGLFIATMVYLSFGKVLVLTAGTDGKHKAGSLHYAGLAIDIRIKYFTTEALHRVVTLLRLRLGSDFDVVLHKTHIHIEYQPK